MQCKPKTDWQLLLVRIKVLHSLCEGRLTSRLNCQVVEGLTFLTMDREVLNIPTVMLRAAVKGKDRKSCLEIVAFSIAIKMFSSSSTLKNPSVCRVSRIFHCGKAKAKRLLETAKHVPMFSYDAEKDLLTAVSWKKHYAEKVTYGKFCTTCMNAVKIDIINRDSIRVTDIERQLDLLLIKQSISSKQREHEFSTACGHSSSRGSDPCLSIEYFASSARMSQRTVIRKLNRIESNGDIVRSCSRLEQADGGNIVIGTRSFRRNANSYAIATRTEQLRFAHIIFGHRKRLSTINHQGTAITAASCPAACTIPQVLGF